MMLLFFYMFFSVSHSIGSHTISLGQSLSEDQTIISRGKFELSPDTVTSTQFIKDPHTLVSKGGIFKLGFFSPVNTTNRYLGVLYNTPATTTAVWVANRKNPLKDSNGSLTISKDGNLVILDGQKQIIWSSNVSSSVANSSAQLSDTGNLVLRDNSNGRTIWESFEHPSDSFLPKMRVGDHGNKDTKNLLNSWRSPSDPSVGDFLAGVDSVYVPQIFVWNGSQKYWRSGPWNGQTFLGVPYMDSVDVNEFTLVDDRYNGGTVYLNFTYAIGPSATYFWLNSEGSLIQRYWIESRKDWEVTWSAVTNECDVYGKCGPYGSCDSKASPICSCLRGFVPKVLEEWNRGNWTSGCVRRKQLLCERNNSTSGEERKEDRFLRLRTMKVPDLAVQNNAPKGNCGSHCLDTCTCKATAYDPTIGCMQWHDSLIDVQKFSGGGGVDLYIRVANSELGSRNKKLLYMAIAISITLALVIVGPVLCFLCLRRRKHKRTVTHGKNQDLLLLNLDNSSKANTHSIDKSGEDKKVLELPMFSFSSISVATNNFSAANKLGEGGFGPVYKGSLVNGQLVAVKRLSKMSGQGLEELRNEAILIAKVQHRNLVRLLGCCTEKDEKILIYEYMPNKSLDSFLFDPNKRELLNWSRRVRIIEGIAQGFLYLHEHSRLRIVHRDLKASNILLDGDMNPKISDFGMARIFGGNQLQANTNRIVGTYGYMSPEYAMEGRFYVKSDVFAFGVLLLEILSGKKNTGFHHLDYLSLLVYAWELWENERALELIDPILQIPYSSSMPLRYILVGLLCIQDNPDDRPTISDVLAMLSNEHTTLASPKRPAFTTRRTLLFASSDSGKAENCSINDLTTSILEAR